MSGTVVVVGSANVDRVVDVSRPPVVGETLLGSHAGRFAGGKGLNQAVAASKYGAVTSLCAAVGSDSDGDFLRVAASKAGVEPNFRRFDEAPTGLAHVLSFPDGDNAIVVEAGANALLDGSGVSRAVRSADVVVAQLEVPVAAVEVALREGRASGATTVLNAAPAVQGAIDLVQLSDILVVNETECTALGGIEALVAAGALHIIVTRGSRGVEWYSPHDARREYDSIAVGAVDTTGAGDAFCGVLAAALSDGLEIPAAVVRASAAGAATAAVVGATSADLSEEALDGLLGQLGRTGRRATQTRI